MRIMCGLGEPKRAVGRVISGRLGSRILGRISRGPRPYSATGASRRPALANGQASLKMPGTTGGWHV